MANESVYCPSCNTEHANMKDCAFIETRAKDAMEALESFARKGGEFYLEDSATEMDADLTEQNMGDLLCNLAHLCDIKGIAFADVLRSAKGHYEAEVAGEGHEQPYNMTQEFEPTI